MDNNKKDIVYQMVINNVILNTFNFNIRMINSEDINKMLQMGMIQVCDNNMYKFMDAKGLYNYGIKLLSVRKKHEAIACFTKCYEIDNSDRNIVLQYFWVVLKKHDYLEVMKIYEKLISISVLENYRDNNLYLFLLSVIVPNLEKKYALRVKSFKYNDMVLPTCECNVLDNDIRNAILHGKYPYACKLLNEKSRMLFEYNVSDEVLRVLLSQAIDAEKQFKQIIYSCIDLEDYDGLITLLKGRESQRNLNRMENSILLIAENIKTILENEVVDFVIDDKNGVDNVYNAILVNDYKKALELNIRFLERNGENPNSDILNILLLKINTLINKYDVVDDVNNEEASFSDDVVEIPDDDKKELVEVIDNEEQIIEEVSDEKEKRIVLEYRDEFECIISDAGEWAYYIKSLGGDVNAHIKRIGLLPRYVLLVKLIYARDYYISGNNDMGDKFLREVENSFLKDMIVEKFLILVKEYKGCKKEEVKVYTRKR